MQENNIKKIIVNSVFTLLVFGLIIWVTIESKIYFNVQLKSFYAKMQSGFETYKIKNIDYNPEKNINPYFGKSQNYEKQPIKILQKLNDVHEIETQFATKYKKEIPEEIETQILNNPLFAGYYIQLGIFKTKEEAEQGIKSFSSKISIEENFTTYIETKYMQETPFFILQLGVFATKEEAVNYCNKLQKLSIGCLIVE